MFMKSAIDHTPMLHLSRLLAFFGQSNEKIGQIFDACHISATRISAQRSLKVVVKTNILLSYKWNILFEQRRVSPRYDKRQKFGIRQGCFKWNLFYHRHKVQRLLMPWWTNSFGTALVVQQACPFCLLSGWVVNTNYVLRFGITTN